MSKLPNHVPVDIKGGDGVQLFLRYYPHEGKTKAAPILLLHGASANHKTFLLPHGKSLTDYLYQEGYEPWLLDWRGSTIVVDHYEKVGWDTLKNAQDKFDFDQAAEYDVPAALQEIKKAIENSPTIEYQAVSAIGFCMGAAVLAQAIAQGRIKKKDKVSHIVLMTIGLFYEAPYDGRLKTEDHILERLLDRKPEIQFVDPRCHEGTNDLVHDWADEFEDLYKAWPGRLRPHSHAVTSRGRSPQHILEQCNRVSFMFGEPYFEPLLVDEVHRRELPEQFGAIPLRMYAQASRNVRRRWAAPFLENYDNEDFLQDKCRKQFKKFTKLTLIAGAKDRIWHRDSIDRMYEWCNRGPTRNKDKYKKLVFRSYGHQDLLWGRDSETDVFPKILESLGPTVS